MSKTNAPAVVHEHVQHVAGGVLHWSPDVWTALGTCVAAGTALAAVLAALVIGRRQLGEAQTLRREQAQPYIAVFIEETGTGIHQYNLVVKNFGATAAKDVRVSITPPPRSANLRNSHAEHYFKIPEVISVLVPGQEWSTYWDWSGALDKATDLPRRYDAEVSFRDSRGKEVDTYQFVLDWEPLIARGGPTRYGIHQVADSLQDISTAIRGVTIGRTSIPVETFDGKTQRNEARRNRRRRERRFRVAGNSQDPPSRLDRVLVGAAKVTERAKRYFWPG
jgi:hypothetical protein